MRKNLVMGVAKGYDWNALEPFVTSFKRNCPSADLVLFVDDISQFTRAQVIHVGGGVVDIPDEVTGILPVNFRFKLYAKYLESYGANYEQILVTDTRDAICQSDVFEPFKKQSSYLVYATERLTIGEDRVWNHPWIERRFGKAEADKLVDKKVICAGTIMGTVKEMTIFCHKMWEFIQHALMNNFDQGTMNYLVHNNLLPIENLIESDIESGAIFTNGLVKDSQIRNDFILRGDGGVPAVVHQYDRHAPQVELVDRVYRDKDFQADENYSDPRSNLEQVKQLVFLGKLNEAARLYMKKFLDGTNFDWGAETLLKIWELLLNRPLTPAVGYLELSLQVALASVKNFPVHMLNVICSLLRHSMKNHRAVDFRFVNLIAVILSNVAEQCLKGNAAAQCFTALDLIKSLDLPPNKDFYLMQAKAYRIFGRKEEALTAYQRALELN